MILALVAAAGATLVSLPDASIVLEVAAPAVAGEVAEAAPPRFVLTDDGTVYVGGSGQVATARLDREALKPIDLQVARVKKLSGLGPAVTFGPGPVRYHLVLRKALDVVASGEPGDAPIALRPLASLIESLAGFDHPSLRPYKPAQYLLQARPSPLLGGCRSWTFALPIAEAVSAARPVPADAAADWPIGSAAAGVCSGRQTYLVSLRPLLPGERLQP